MFQEAVKQWENLHNVTDPSVVTTSEYTHSVYWNKKLETWYIFNFGHAYPLKNCDTVQGYYQTGPICATQIIADFFFTEN